jgi:hypothetical protein
MSDRVTLFQPKYVLHVSSIRLISQSRPAVGTPYRRMCVRYKLVHVNTLSGMRCVVVYGTAPEFELDCAPCWVLAHNLQVTGCHFLILYSNNNGDGVRVMIPDNCLWKY